MAARRKTTKRAKRTSVRRAVSRPSSVSRSSSDRTMFLLAAALVVAIGGYLFLSARTPAPAPVALTKMATVALATQNASGEAGTATLKEVGGKVVVTLDVVGAPADVAQPAHIHMGACPEPGAVKYPLTSPVGGKSETTLDVSFDDLMAQLPLAVNVHKSVAQSKVYVACGDVTKPSY